MRIFCTHKTIRCSSCDQLQHPASCRLSLDHDEINKYLYENCIRRFDIGYICEAQYRKYNCIRKVVITLILTTKIEIANSTLFLNEIYRFTIQNDDAISRFDTFTVAVKQLRRLNNKMIN